MINSVVINTAFKSFFTTYAGVFSMQADINRARPPLPYITFDTSSLVPIGHDSVLTPDDTGKAEIIGDREFTVPVEYYGDDPIVNLENLYSIMITEAVKKHFEDAGLVFVQLMGNINNLTVLVDTKYESRAGMDLLFRIASIVEDSGVGYIDGEKISYEYKIDDIKILDGDMESGKMPI